MSQKSGYFGKPFMIWVLANILGFAALGAAPLLPSGLISLAGMFGSTLMISIPIGIAQWIGLRRITPISILWTLTVPLGMLAGVSFFKAFDDIGLPQVFDDESMVVIVFLYMMMGFAVGLPQWLLLRRQYPNSALWLLGSSMGVGAGIGLVGVTDLVNRSGVLAYIAAVLVYAVVTGVTLSRILGDGKRSESIEH
ncbi:MAG: hypothetical protein ABFS03_09140 [Chloroflexota bacterium]